MRDIQFQIQSIQGAGIRNPFKYAFAMSDGNLATAEYVAGDYTNSNLVVTTAMEDASEVTDGKVKVNGVEYTKPVATTPNQVITLEAENGTTDTFSHWCTGSKEKKIQFAATGMSMGITAFFKKG